MFDDVMWEKMVRDAFPGHQLLTCDMDIDDEGDPIFAMDILLPAGDSTGPSGRECNLFVMFAHSVLQASLYRSGDIEKDEFIPTGWELRFLSDAPNGQRQFAQN